MTDGITLSPREKETLKLLTAARTLSVGFESKSRPELLSAIKETELSMPMLNICQAFAKTKTYTDKELFLLNYFSASVKRSPAFFGISRLLVNEPYIAEAYKDAIEKYAVLTPNYKAPCNLYRFLSLGTEAINFSAPRSYSLSDIALFSGEDSPSKRINCAFRGYYPASDSSVVFERKDVPKRSAGRLSYCKAAIIYSDNETSDDLESFFSIQHNTSGITFAFATSPDTLFTKLLSFNKGISIDADALKDVDILPNLPKAYRDIIKVSNAFFSKEAFGQTAVVVIAPKSKLKKICDNASQNGLSVCNAICFKKPADVSVLSGNQVIAHLPLNLLTAIREMIGHQANVVTHDHETLIKETRSEKIFESKNGQDAVYRTSFSISDSPAPYHEAIYSVLSLVLSACRDGFDLTGGDMRLSVRASLSPTSHEKIGEALAAILGIYKIETEFAIPDENSIIDYADEKSEMTISLRAHSSKPKDKNEKYTSIDPLLFKDLDENGLPNLKILRDFAFGRCSVDVISDTNK